MYKVCIIDDHKIVRDGLKAMLITAPQYRVVSEAATADEAKAVVGDADIAFVDLKLGEDNGATLIGELTKLSPDIKCILLTAEPNATDLQRALSGGAMGFLTKDIDTEEYLLALDKVSTGKKYISSVFSDLMINEQINLTPRELEVLQGFSDGLSYKEIGDRLDISPRTVETHKNTLLKKMDVKSIVEMVRAGIREALIQA